MLCQAAASIQTLAQAGGLQEAGAKAALQRLAGFLKQGAYAKTTCERCEVELLVAREALVSAKAALALLEKRKAPSLSQLTKCEKWRDRGIFDPLQTSTPQERLQRARSRQLVVKKRLSEERAAREQEVKLQEERIQHNQRLREGLFNDVPALVVLDLESAVRALPALCKGRLLALGRKHLVQIWASMAKLDAAWKAYGSLSGFLTGVEVARRRRSSETVAEALVGPLLDLQALDGMMLHLAVCMGAVEDLRQISTSVRQGSSLSIDCLRVLATVSEEAKERVSVYDRSKESLRESWATTSGLTETVKREPSEAEVFAMLRSLVGQPIGFSSQQGSMSLPSDSFGSFF